LNLLLLQQGKEREARILLSRTIHQHPASAGLWRSLAHVLLSATQAAPIQHCAAAATCAATAAKLAQAAGNIDTIAQVDGNYNLHQSHHYIFS